MANPDATEPLPGSIEAAIVKWFHEGLTVVAMGERIGCRKNAMTGKLRRMREAGYDLPLRPILGRPKSTVPKERPPSSRRTPPPAAVPVVAPPPAPPVAPAPVFTRIPAAEPEEVEPEQLAAPPRKGTHYYRNRSCTYIKQMRGEGTGALIICEAPTEGDPTYCPEHRSRCVIFARPARSYDPRLPPATSFGSMGEIW